MNIPFELSSTNPSEIYDQPDILEENTPSTPLSIGLEDENDIDNASEVVLYCCVFFSYVQISNKIFRLSLPEQSHHHQQ